MKGRKGCRKSRGVRDPNVTYIQLDLIVPRPETQVRFEINRQVVEEYAALMRDGVELGPITVFEDGKGGYILADGFHRYEAARSVRKDNGKDTIPCVVKRGDLRDAVLCAIKANAKHGLPLTNEDKRKVIGILLRDKVWRGWSARKIGLVCGVNHGLVSKVRKESSLFRRNSDKVKYRDRYGNVTTMNVSGSGGKNRGKDALTYDITRIGKGLYEAKVTNKGYVPHLNEVNYKIEWAGFSWGPVSGCLGKCEFCYARDMAEAPYFRRVFPKGFLPTFHPDRLSAPERSTPLSTGSPGDNLIFVCSMADLFGDWIVEKTDWVEKVLAVVRKRENQKWNFAFLTKNPKVLPRFNPWPKNAWVGCTVYNQDGVKEAEKAFADVNATVKFLSCEPFKGPIKFRKLHLFNWVIVGGQSPTKKFPNPEPVKWEEVGKLVEQARKAGCKVYFKPNLDMPKEYPGQVTSQSRVSTAKARKLVPRRQGDTGPDARHQSNAA